MERVVLGSVLAVCLVVVYGVVVSGVAFQQVPPAICRLRDCRYYRAAHDQVVRKWHEHAPEGITEQDVSKFVYLRPDEHLIDEVVAQSRSGDRDVLCYYLRQVLRSVTYKGYTFYYLNPTHRVADLTQLVNGYKRTFLLMDMPR